MAFLVALFLSAVFAFGAFRYVVSRQTRAAAHQAVAKNPKRWAFVVFGALCLMMFFWGVLIPSFGEIAIPIDARRSIPLWQIGGFGSLIWLVLWFWIGEQ